MIGSKQLLFLKLLYTASEPKIFTLYHYQNSSELPVYRKKLQDVERHFLFPEANSHFRKFTGSRISGCLFFSNMPSISLQVS